MSHFRLHTNTKEREYLKYLVFGLIGLIAAGAVGYGIHSIGQARARSQETVLIFTEEEFTQYLVDRESEEYDLNGRYRLEEDLDLSGLKTSIGSNIDPFTGRLDGNGHVISRLARPLFGVTREAEIENLFLSEAEILYPFTYYDGEHYVDGYGALAAYAVDTTIRNCGMGGDIYTVTPTEASYQIGKASPADGEEEKGPGELEQIPGDEIPGESGDAGSSGGTDGGSEFENDGGPGMESNIGGESGTGSGSGTGTEAGPGVETGASAGNETESGTNLGPGVETEGDEGSGAESGSNGESGAETGSNGESGAETGSNGGSGAETGNNGESGAETEANGGSGAETGVNGGSGAETGVNGESGAETGANGGSGAETGGNGGSSAEAGGNGGSGAETGANGGSGAETEANGGSGADTGTNRGDSTTTGSNKSDSSIDENIAVESGGQNYGVTSFSKEVQTQAVVGIRSSSRDHSISAVSEADTVPAETVGYRANERQYLMLKVTAMPETIEETPEIGPGVMVEETERSDGMDDGIDPVSVATPSEATPADAEEEGPDTEPEDPVYSEPEEPEHTGDQYILVTADQIRAGGLVAEAAGSTLISDCFVLAAISSEQKPVESYAGGLAGILGENTRTENSYASGLMEHIGMTGGFVSVNRGTIQNCYSTVILGREGSVRGAFVADDRGTIVDCVYDRQMASVEENVKSVEEEDMRVETPAEAEEGNETFEAGVQGLGIKEMAGLESEVPGTWYLAEQAYPQIEYFAGSGHETITSYSKASVIVLPLEPGTTLLELQEGSDLLLPSEVDGQPILWNGKGGVSIDENNQAKIESAQISMEPNEVPVVEMALNTECSQEQGNADENTAASSDNSIPENSALEKPVVESDTSAEGSENPTSESENLKAESENLPAESNIPVVENQIPTVEERTAPIEKSPTGVIFEATVGTATRRIMGSTGAAATAGSYKNWEEVAMAIAGNTLSGDSFIPEKNAAGVYEIRTPEALAWFAYQVKTDDTMQTARAVLMNHIQLTGDRGYGGAEDMPLLWIPIGTTSKPYQGNFDGGGHVIDNMRVEQNGYAGLFACAGGGATIRKLGIGPNSRISSTTSGTGSAEDGTAAFVGAVIQTGTPIAQLVIEGCYNRGTVVGASRRTGAFVGNGAVETPGGQRIAGCYNTGRIEMTGDVATERPGAIAGAFSSDLSVAGAGITNCYWDEESTGSATVTAVGASATDAAVMAAGVEESNALPPEDMKSSEAVALLNESATEENYWQYQPWLEGQDYPVFYDAAAVPANWIEVGKNMYDNNQTPEGTGEPDAPFQIGTPEELAWFMYYVDKGSVKHYAAWATLTANIDLTGSTYGSTFNETTPMMWGIIAIGVNGSMANSYQGTFDGKYHTISSLYFEGYSAQMGFIGTLHNTGVVQNLYLDKMKIISTAKSGKNCMGGIVGQQGGIIQRCGILSGSIKLLRGSATLGAVGGITGDFLGGKIIDCFNRASASTDYKDYTFNSGVGGMAGRANSGQMINCYNTGVITGGQNRNGMSQYGTKTNCFVQSGTAPTGGSTALTADQFKTADTVSKLNASRTPGPWKYTAGQYPDFGIHTDLKTWSDVGYVMELGWFSDKALSSDTTVEDGSPAKPYKIKTPEQLAQFAYRVNQGNPTLCAELTADINLFGNAYHNTTYIEDDSTMKSKALPWIPIGDGNIPYTGTFNGNGHTISLLRAQDAAGTKPQGLFGTVGGDGKVTGVGIRDSLLGGKVIGGITGRLDGAAAISRCFIREITSFECISGSGVYCGGIAGGMYGTSTIKDCYSMDMAVTKGGGTGSCGGGITGAMASGTHIYNSYTHNARFGMVSGTALGNLAGKQDAAGTIHQCYVDLKFPNDKDSGIAILVNTSKTDAEIQKQADDLNTMNGVERKGSDRAWYTSLRSERTKGMPTLQAPESLTVTVNPADVTATVTNGVAALTGSQGTLTGAALPADTWLRSIRRENNTDQAYLLKKQSDVSSNFYKYGSDNANTNLALTAGTTELANLTPSLLSPGAAAATGTFTTLTLYNGGAYIYPQDRTLLIDLAGSLPSGEEARYELRVTVSKVAEKMLSVVMGNPGRIELVPGKEKEAYTQDLRLENRCAYPLQVTIASVTPKAAAGDIDVQLNPTDSVDETKSLVSEGVRLGITSPLANDTGTIGSRKFYYLPPSAGTTPPATAKWISSQMEGKQTLWYRYFMEYSHVYLGPGDEKFGYEINYQFEIPKADVNGIQVAGN